MKQETAIPPRIIETKPELLAWLSRCLLASKPQIPINKTLIGASTHIIAELEEYDIYSRDSDTLEEMLYAIFDSVNQPKSTAVCAGKLLWFVAATHIRIIERGYLSIDEAILILIEKLKYNSDIIRIRPMGTYYRLESTPICASRFEILIRVRLDEVDDYRMSRTSKDQFATT